MLMLLNIYETVKAKVIRNNELAVTENVDQGSFEQKYCQNKILPDLPLAFAFPIQRFIQVTYFACNKQGKLFKIVQQIQKRMHNRMQQFGFKNKLGCLKDNFEI